MRWGNRFGRASQAALFSCRRDDRKNQEAKGRIHLTQKRVLAQTLPLFLLFTVKLTQLIINIYILNSINYRSPNPMKNTSQNIIVTTAISVCLSTFAALAQPNPQPQPQAVRFCGWLCPQPDSTRLWPRSTYRRWHGSGDCHC